MKKLKIVLLYLAFAVIGGIGGYLLGPMLDDVHFGLWEIIVVVLSLVISFLLHIAIHEAGHGLFGWLSGYKMVSYRILSYLWIWQPDGRIQFRRFSVPGTLGQCLMAPPPYRQGQFPYKRYLFGGVLANIIASLVIGLTLGFRWLPAAVFALVGILVALPNIIPAGFNDGMSIKVASSSEEQTYLFYIQIAVNYQLMMGHTFKELPDEFFQAVPEIPERTYFNTSQSFLIAGRALELHDWPRFSAELEKLWQMREDLIVIYQIELKKELLFCLCLLSPEDERIAELWQDKQVRASLKQTGMANKRIEAMYAYAVEHDNDRAQRLLAEGRALLPKAPNPGDGMIEFGVNDWLAERMRDGAWTAHNTL